MARKSQSPEQECVSARKRLPSAAKEKARDALGNLVKRVIKGEKDTKKEEVKPKREWLDEKAHPLNRELNRRNERNSRKAWTATSVEK
ncbi:hypothetical protein BOTCAL_0011g00380 [Botryotinia calthae]|uniref:Uncharacterized protein n=1 Tax=Botryotinia calthae TaxID=38488 RepID=A0A4Y8DG88_9HELO|nr:hypothetical protein BOTCAL_0011g00380 [Botryotinia calthae]